MTQELRIVTWNIEWMNNLFSNNIPKTESESVERFNQIGSAISDMDPDILIIQEGPNEYPEMESFVDQYAEGVYTFVRAPLREKNPVTGRGYGDTQVVWALYRQDRNLTHTEVENSEYNGPFQNWKQIIDPALGDPEQFFHLRLPLEVDFTYDDGTKQYGPLKFFGLHPKSKKTSSSSGAKENRRKLLAEAINIRNWIDYLLNMNPERYIVVCGDMNDGVGLDEFEYSLGGDFASIITGTARKPHQLFLNVCEKQILENLTEPGKYFSLKFGNEGPYERLLVDYILLSPMFKRDTDPNARSDTVSFVLDSGNIRNDILGSYPESSDHAPVEARIKIP